MQKETKIGTVYIAILNVKVLSYSWHFVGKKWQELKQMVNVVNLHDQPEHKLKLHEELFHPHVKLTVAQIPI